jgi:ferredoxin
MNDDELPVVDEDRCTACGKCVAACPKKLFSLVPVDKGYAIRCKSLDSGKKVMLSCSIGCIACGRCVEACPSKAIRITDNLAMIDYNLCLNKGECFQVCPTKAIAAKQEGRWVSRR